MKQQKKLSLPTRATAEKIKELKRLDQEKLKTYRQKFGTVTEFLNSCYPHLGAVAPTRLREGAVMELTTHHLAAAEKRLETCAKCPEHGGACREDHLGHPIGTVPTWAKRHRNKVSLVLAPCERWHEWVIRQRTIRAGVEPRLAGISFDDTQSLVKEDEDGKLIGAFILGCRRHENNNLVISGKASTALAISIVRSLLNAIPDYGIRYVRCAALASPMKKYFGDPPNQPDPRPELRSIELLVMTQTVIYERPTWLDEEICEVIYERYLDNKPTLLATTAPEPHLISNHYFQTSVPVCLTK